MAESKLQATFSDSKSSPAFVIKTVEMHTGGHPLRIITDGYPKIEGKTILEKRAYVRDNLDVFRKRLMWEPRGHYDMYGAMLVDPDYKGADIGVLFMHNEGYSTMCGHACIALGRYAVDKGVVPAKSPQTELVIQCPTGPVKVWVDYQDGKSGRVRFHSVPAFVFALDQEVDVPNYGRVKVDIAYGGAFYAFLPDRSLGLDLRTAPIHAVRNAATPVTEAVKKAVPLCHPEHPDLAFLYGTTITDGRDEYDPTPTANTCVFGDASVDRSPTGSGVTARVAIQYRRGQIDPSKERQFASGNTGSVMTGRPVRETTWGEFDRRGSGGKLVLHRNRRVYWKGCQYPA
ncbi:Hypp2448 [Branchiostoma lanceolatum]|uniref:trans-L-3-hydroxyproline dehydratase n=1 Tax=Branchiostoma lanceolatum TaxID=7740 RepID=A0A8K0EPS8_BRALA|nr:Hypp2448 [Branchiostoma lanceolatum]